MQDARGAGAPSTGEDSQAEDSRAEDSQAGDSRAEDSVSGALWPGHALSADPFAPGGLPPREESVPSSGPVQQSTADRPPLSRGYRHPSLPPGPTGPQARVAALRRRRRGCCVVAPIVLHGRAWGELYVARPLGAPVFGREDADFATVLASVIASGIAQTERLEEVRRLAFTDPLTGLANRRAVDARLDEALERHRDDGSVVSLVVCDLNGLKQVNDTHGHAVGDRLLERFGSVLSLCGAMLPGALVARLGGDEFCLVSVGPTSDEVVRVADELCVRAAEMELGDGVACGVASTGDPIGQVRSARRLFRLADAAQYRAKAARSAKPVIAGRDGTVLQLADTPPRPQHQQERRRFRGVAPEDVAEPWSEP
ncbi:diguanylate cyclase domain-containing protein [Streptomyces sp. NPDC059129]|uniref:diguanylate cyclase domain-containing protein n=1 Tax=unclassified Streptomyces TaxID=2593676 RepID=UPI00369B44E6